VGRLARIFCLLFTVCWFPGSSPFLLFYFIDPQLPVGLLTDLCIRFLSFSCYLLSIFLGCCSSSFSLWDHISGEDLDFKVRAYLHLLVLRLCCEKLIHIYMCSCCCLHLIIIVHGLRSKMILKGVGWEGTLWPFVSIMLDLWLLTFSI